MNKSILRKDVEANEAAVSETNGAAVPGINEAPVSETNGAAVAPKYGVMVGAKVGPTDGRV